MFVGVDHDDTEFIINPDIGDQKGSVNYVEEMMLLSRDFNARFGGDKQPDEPEPDEDAGAD